MSERVSPYGDECGWPAWTCKENGTYAPCDQPCRRREAYEAGLPAWLKGAPDADA